MTIRKTLLRLASAAVLAGPALPASAHDPKASSASVTGDRAPAEPAAVVDDFHAALTAGDIPAALMRLADDAAVFESGGVERGKAEYAAHHAAADAAFAKAVPSRIVRRTGQAFGDTAWVLTEGRTKGVYNDREVDRVTTETMVLRRQGAAWRIVHIHWSSAAARPAAKSASEEK
jgi:ketosteroid isomerase-like protein